MKTNEGTAMNREVTIQITIKDYEDDGDVVAVYDVRWSDSRSGSVSSVKT